MGRAAPWIIVAVLAVAGVWAAVGRAEAVARADVHEERADSAEARSGRLAAANADLLRGIDVRDSAYAADSIRWEAERAENAARAAAAERRATRTATDLRATLTSAQDSLLTAYERDVAEVLAAKDRTIASMEIQVVDLRERVSQRNALIEGLYMEIEARQEIVTELYAANQALRHAVAPSFLTRLWDNVELLGIGAAAGALAWELAR